MSLDMGLGDYGLGDYGLGDYGLGDYGLGDYGLGDYGLGDYGLGDYGLGDYGLDAPGELDLETALATGAGAPNSLTALVLAGTPRHVRLRWAAPPVSEVATYEVFRVLGQPSDIGQATRIGIVTAPLTEFIDTGGKPAGRTYTYFVIAVSIDGARSPQSNLAVIQVP